MNAFAPAGLTVLAAIAGAYLCLLAARATLAWRAIAGHRRATAATAGGEPAVRAIAILQPILAGDPDLERCLGSTLHEIRALRGARFLWLVDEDDAEGLAIVRRLADVRVRVLVGPPPADGENPKLAKLERALALLDDADIAVVLDDDTTIAAASLAHLVAGLRRDGASAATSADLVTGLPVFVAAQTIYERFVAGFVNGNALLTYLPAAAVGVQRTLNGMIYATPVATLRALGGFTSIRGELTDDYAVARLYERGGRTLRQIPAPAAVGMTIRDAAHCGRVLRRWLIFANRYLRENLGGWTLALVLLPSLLAIAGTAAGSWFAIRGSWAPAALWLGCLTAKALTNRILLARWTAGGRALPAATALPGALPALAFEVLVDLLLPAIYVSAWVRPREMRWRSRRIDVRSGGIRYR